MRRGQNSSSKNDAAGGWTKQELMAAVGAGDGSAEADVGRGTRRGGLSAKTFDMIRKAARVGGPSHGGLTWVFSPEEVAAMVRCAEGGRFTQRGGPIAAAWRALLADRGIAIEENRQGRR